MTQDGSEHAGSEHAETEPLASTAFCGHCGHEPSSDPAKAQDLAALTEKLARAEAERDGLLAKRGFQITFQSMRDSNVQLQQKVFELDKQLAAARAEREAVVAAIEWVLSDAKYRSPELINDVAERWIARLKQAARS